MSHQKEQPVINTGYSNSIQAKESKKLISSEYLHGKKTKTSSASNGYLVKLSKKYSPMSLFDQCSTYQ